MKRTYTLMPLALLAALWIGCGHPEDFSKSEPVVSSSLAGDRVGEFTEPEPDWVAAVQKTIADKEYSIQRSTDGAGFSSPNRQNNLRIAYLEDGFSLKPRVDSTEHWNLRYQVQGLFRTKEQVVPLPDSPLAELEGNRLVQHFGGGFHVIYTNGPEGMRQNFVVERKLGGAGALRLRIGTSGSLIPERKTDTEVVLIDGSQGAGSGDVKVRYRDLKVFDANGGSVSARMEAGAASEGEFPGDWMSSIDLVVEDEGAAYPLFIDPISTTEAIRLEMDQTGAEFGNSVSSAGDVNGDGYSDVIVGARYYDSGLVDEGAAFLFYGSPTGVSPVPAVTLDGNQTGAQFGWSVGTAGDLNADGKSDVIIGANLFDNGQVDEGAAFVYYGAPAGLVVMGTLLVESDQANAQLGYSVGCAGDVNGDGRSDVIVGAPGYDGGQVDEGAAFVYHGQYLIGLNPVPGAILETNQANAAGGSSVGGAGDVNGDGVSDIIWGAPLYDLGQVDEGAAFVHQGVQWSGISIAPATTVESNQANAQLGRSVGTAGDVDGDGNSDVVVGANHYSNGQLNEGAAFIYLGSSIGISPIQDTILESNQANAELGICVACAGDVNGDGYSDVVAGAWQYGAGNGAAFVYQGGSTGINGAVFTLLQPSTPGGSFGQAVFSAGDVNGDGISDIVVGANTFSNGQANEGGVFVFHGSTTTTSLVAGAQFRSYQIDAQLGNCVASAGDVNGDGFSDVIIGSKMFDNGQTDEGAAFIYLGSAGGIDSTFDAMVEGNRAGIQLGYFVSSAGDIDGDGLSDVVVSALNYNGQGGLFVYHGIPSGIDTTADTILVPPFSAPNFGETLTNAGDVNADGYSDIIAGSLGYTNGQSQEGVAVIYHGSANGIIASPATILEINQAGANFGKISSAGDINGDGYADVIIGAQLYDDTQIDEGAVFIYYGDECGIISTNSTMLVIGQAGSNFGSSVASAGDVNADGFGDIVVGAPQYDNVQVDEGAAFVYFGSSNGIVTTSAIILEENQGGAWLGNSVAGAGDVNGDGYADVIVGAWYYPGGGAAFVYPGSPTGTSTVASTTLMGSGQFGVSVNSAGDVDGDGYSDVVVGAHGYTAPLVDEGAAWVFYGNGGSGLLTKAQQFQAGSLTPLVAGGAANSAFQAQLSMQGKSFIGRQIGRMRWEVRQNGAPFSWGGNGITNSVGFDYSSFGGYGMTGSGAMMIEGFSVGLPWHDFKWRSRVAYDPVTALTGQVSGPWYYEKSRSTATPMLGFKNIPFPTQEIEVSGNSVVILDGDTIPATADFTDFGAMAVCGDTLLATYYVQNIGSLYEWLGVFGVGLSGPAASDFLVIAQPPTALLPGPGDFFQIQFNPTAVGVRDATVTIYNDDCDEAVFTFAIRGVGLADTTAPNINACIGSQTVLVNSGCGAAIPDFTTLITATDNCGAVNISQPAPFAPGTVLNGIGTVATMLLVAQDTSGNTDTCSFVLTTTGPDLLVTGNLQTILEGDLSPSPSDGTDFGATYACNGSAMMLYQLKNQGNAFINLANVGISGPHAAEFSIPVPPASIVAPGDSTTVAITFDPADVGLRIAQVDIASDDCDVPAYSFAIQGMGAADTVRPILINCLGDQFITLNTVCEGVIPDYRGAVSAIDDCGIFEILQDAPWGPGTLVQGAGMSLPLSLIARDSSGNADTCNFTLRTNRFEIMVTGDGDSIPDGSQFPIVQNNTDFGTVSGCGDSVVKPFVIHNRTATVFSIDRIDFSGTNPSDFTAVDGQVAAIFPDDSTAFEIRFLPLGSGTRSARITIEAGGCSPDTFRFAVEGNVSVPTEPNAYLNYGTIATTVPFARYQWYRNGTMLFGQTGPTLSPNLPGQYYVTVVNFDSCRGQSNSIDYDPNAAQGQNNVFVSYPNPIGSENLSVQLLDSANFGKPFDVDLYNLLGQVVLSFHSESVTGFDSFDVHSLAAGYYHVRVIVAQNAVDSKVIQKLR